VASAERNNAPSKVNRASHLTPRVPYSSIVLAIAVIALGRAVFAAFPHTTINGIYALGSASHPMPEVVFASNAIDGVALRYWWKSLEPRPRVYDWLEIDRDIAIARAHGKKISLSVAAGFGTPQWLYDSNVARFTFRWTKTWGAPPCSEQRIPVPWDPVFLSEWCIFVRELGHRYGSDPTVVLVKLTGVNGASEETNLPHETGTFIRRGAFSCFSTDDIAEWRRLGYSREKVEAAWKVIADTFSESFPHKHLAIMTGPSFPRVDDLSLLSRKNGKPDAQIAAKLIADGIASYGDRFVVQSNGLSAFWNWKKVATLAGRVSTGYQMLWSVTDDRGCRMNHHVAPCDPQTILDLAIDRGIGAGADYLEIYTADIMNPALHEVVLKASARLPTRSALR
jgi:hypothetical protein